MALHTGYTGSAASGGTASYSAADCIRLGTAASGTTSGTILNTGGVPVSSATTGNTAYAGAGYTVWAAHGTGSQRGTCPTLLDLSSQSALGFTPASITSLVPGTIFNLGRMTHINNGVYALSRTYYRGNLNIGFMGMTLPFSYEMNETTGTNVADTTTFLNQLSDQSFTFNGVSYTMIVRGFTATQAGTACSATVTSLGTVSTTFTTPESATSNGCLYAQVEEVRPLTIQKVVAAPYGAPATYPTFGYTASSDVAGSPWGSNFTLSPTAAGLAGRAVRTANLVTGQTINVAETAPTDAAWSFTGLTCVDGAGNSDIAGLTITGAGLRFSGDYSAPTASTAPITCTYTNSYTPRATLTLVKQVTTTGQSGTLATPSDWTLSATGSGTVAGQAVSGASGSAAVTTRTVIAGSYSLAEVGSNPATTAGYVQDGSWSCTSGTLNGSTLTLTAGESAVCTVRNKFAIGKLAITKTVTGDGYADGTSKAFSATYLCTHGTATVRSGTVTVHPAATNGTAGAPVTIDNVPAGANCTVTEADAPTGTDTDLVNPSWTWVAPANPATVTISADRTSTVNITNATTRRFGSLQLSKVVSPRAGVPGAGYTGGSSRAFPITYSCTLGGEIVSSGTVDVATGAARTIPGIPAASTCSVTGEDQAPKTGDFLDPSYAWAGYSASDAVTIKPNGTGTVTVTNYFQRDLVDLNLAKVVTGNGYTGSGNDFRLDYDCGAPYAGTVSVAAGDTETVTVPAGVACTVAERAPASSLLKSGYVWDDPTYAGLTDGTIAVARGTTGTVTVTNPTRIGYGRIQVTKEVDSFADQVASGTTFELAVACNAAAKGEPDDHAQTFTLTWPSATSGLTPYLPVGTSCTVTETAAPTGHEALPNASYAWQAAPEPITVKVPAAEDARRVTVTNDIKRVHARFEIAKDIINHTGHGTGGHTFSGGYRCDYNNGEDVRTGSWNTTGPGLAAGVDVLVGSVCTVSEDNPGAPVDGDRSYTWSTQTPAPTTVGKDGAVATVVNTLNRAEGGFSVTKSVEGGTAGNAFPAGADFGFSYTCTPLTGDPITGGFGVAAGDSKGPAEDIPGGSTCTVTEGDYPGALDPFRWDGVSLSVTGDAGHSGQDGRSITFTTSDDAQPVSVRAVNSISARTAQVTVSKTVTGETSGFTAEDDAIFPVTLTCTGAGAQGTRLVAAGGSATWTGIPLGSTCSATEGSTTAGLRDGSFAWAEASVGEPVKLAEADGSYEISIRNPIERVYAGIEIAKLIDDSGHAGVIDADAGFSGDWTCQYGDDPAVTGTWHGSGSASGDLVALTGDAGHILIGSRCSVTEDTALLGSPSSDPSYRWDETPEYRGVTVAGAAVNRLSVTNILLRDTGRVSATKELSGEADGYAPAGGFAGFSVTARCYLDDPQESGRLEATVHVRPGDTETVIDQVPYGWTCDLGEGPFPSPSQLRDASFAWDSQSVSFPGGGATTMVTAANDSPNATVTNGIRRVTGALAISKAFGDGTLEAVEPGTTFTGGYRCTYGSESYTGHWTVTGDGSATLAGDTAIPFTAECTATESDPSDADLIDSSYTWAEPDLGGTVRIASAAEPAELVVTNTATRRWSGLEITKAHDGPGSAFDPALTVTGSWSCSYQGQVAASGGWALPATGGSTVVARPTDEAIPAESVCTVTEDTLLDSDLTDSSYTWRQPSYTPAGGQLATAAGETAGVTVTNATTRVLESFTVTKQLLLGNDVEPAAVESSLTFSGHYRCTHDGADPVTGKWGPIAGGAEWTSPPVLVGSACAVTAEDEPDRPSSVDDSYVWGTPDLGQPVTVVPAGQQRTAIVVGNPVNRITGSFGVTKELTGDTEGIDPAALYTFEWTCRAADGTLFPEDAPGTFGLTNGSTWNAPDSVPVGSDCQVTEAAPPAPEDPSYEWAPELTVAGAPGTTSGRRASFVLPRTDSPVAVTATNRLTRTKGSFTIAKTSDPADGATVMPGQAIHYTVTVTGAPVGFTSDVVVTDALADVRRHAEVSDIATTQGSAALTGDDLIWNVGTVRANATLALTYTATVAADAIGVTLANTASATGETDPPACGAACATVHHTPAWTLAKTSDPVSGSIVAPTDTITYTLKATNTSAAQVIGATALDDLAGLADADVQFTSTQLSRCGDTLTWAIPTLASGEEATVTYTATVRPGADGATLANRVVPEGVGGSCASGCTTRHASVKWSLAKSANPATGAVVAPGDTITYTLDVTNTGPVPVTPTVTDDISGIVDDAVLGELPAGLTRSGDLLAWAVPELGVGDSASISYTATVAAGARGATLRNTAAPASTGGHCSGSCSTIQTTPKWSLAKTSTAGNGATVKPGDTIGYTLSVTNDGPATLHGAEVTDDLSGVLDDATFGVLPDGAAIRGSTLTWAVPDVAPGATAELTYQVNVKPEAVGASLTNTARPNSTGGDCAAGCTTTAHTPKWTLAKTSDPATGSVVAPGQVITYTLTATNAAEGTITGATAVDSLASVLANADVEFTSSQLSRSGETLTWTIPTLLPGESATAAYTATIKPAATGVTVTNSVSPVGAGGSCSGCTTSQSTARWGLTKTSNPATGAVVRPGDTIDYTLTVVNEGPVPVTGATVTDDVSGLVDDADLTALPAGLARSGDQLTWTVPTIAVGGVASITYSATVRNEAGGATITNSAAPVGAGGHCSISCSTTAWTDAWTLTKTSDPADGASVDPGDVIGYTLSLTNTGRATLHGAVVVDDLSDVLDDATLGSLPAEATLTGNTLAWSVPDVPAGDTVTLGYEATVHPDATGAQLRNIALPATVGGTCAGSCSSTLHTGAWTLAKSSLPASGAVVEPGDELTYTLTATNASAATITGAVATDDLGQVLPSAAVGLDSPELNLTGTTLTWAIPALAPGQTRTVSYTARVLAGAAGATIANSARPQDVGGSCPVACVTTHTTPAWRLAKVSNPASGSEVAPGDTLDYTLSVTNTGPTVLTGAVVTDDVSGLVDDASLAALPAGLSRSADQLTWEVPAVPAGATVSVTYSATVAAGARGATITNTATPASAGGSCAGTCTTTSRTPSWTLTKASDQPSGATVHPGDLIGYTLAVTNTGPATLHAAQVSDDLSDVLDDADLVAVPDGATLTGATLAWAVPDVALGSTVELAYQVRVKDLADGARLANSAAPASAGGRCDTSCATLALTPAWRLTKTSDPATGAVVAPGDTITYTLTATNTGAAPVSGATATDDLSGVLAAATIQLDSAELNRTGTTLTWAIPTLVPGQTRTVTYTAKVLAGANGATLRNSVTPDGQGGSCGAGCSTTQSTVQWSLAKTSDAAPGAVLKPGDVIGYTLTATNTGPVPVAGAVVSDDISDLVDDADLGVLPGGVSRSADILSWAVPELAVGSSRSVSYLATIRPDALGATLRNAAAAASTGGSCGTFCTTVQYTDGWHLAKTSSVGPGATVQPGNTVDYTLTVTNDGPATLRDAVVVDDASGLLANANLVAVPAGASRLGDQLTWKVPEVAPGARVALTYQVVVAADAVGATLANTAAPASPGGTCAGDCSTVAHTPAWTLAKTSDPADGATVQPGDVITYTLTATNTSAAEIRGALALDDLSRVLSHAEVSFSSPQLERTGDLLTWAIPTLARGESASVTYTASVTAGADGVTLTNSVSPVGAGGSCIGGCATSQSTAGWTLAKTSDPGSGAQVLPGDEIHYTLTATNTGPVPVTGALVADNLTEVLDDALVTDLGADLSRSGSTLVWAVPDIPVGGHASVGYTATVAGGSVGATITNAAAPVGSGGHCLTCTTTQTTPGWTLAKTSNPADGATVEPGQTVQYALTVTNTGTGTLTGAVVTDDLAGVLDDASLGALPAGVAVTGDRLTWTVPDVAPGGTATVGYAATVHPTAVGATLHNSAAPATPGGSCRSSCSTTARTPAWTLAKTSSPGDGAAVLPGDVITYTLTATNTSAAVVSGATAVDNLADVLDDAIVAPTADGLHLAGDELTWAIPVLVPGASASIDYAAVVREAGATITNTVVPVGAGGSCAACATTQTSPSWTLAKTSAPASGSMVEPGDPVGYTLTVINTGPAELVGARVTDDVSGLVDDAILGVLPTGITRTGNLLTWAVPTVPVGGTASATYAATVFATGATLTNSAAAVSPGGTCLACTTTAYTSKWSLAKTSSPGDGATVAVGSPVGYTLTVTNDGPATLHGAVVSDDLSDVLDDATLATLPAGASVSGSTLTWKVPDVEPGARVDLHYAAVVNADATGATLRNIAAPASPGGACVTGCSTTHHTGAWTLWKTSDPGDGAVVQPGDVITYTLTATNTSAAVVSGARASDDISGVLDDATVDYNPAQLSRSGDTLTWAIPTLAAHETRQVSYTATVTADGATITNRATPIGSGGTCASCTTTQYTAAWSLAKTSDPASGTVVEPGDAINYTLTVTNTGPVPLTGAVASDDLSDILEHAAIGDLAAELSVRGSELTWRIPTVPVGETVHVSYPATVDVDALGVSLTNKASTSTPGGTCTTCTTTAHTPAWALTKTSTVGDGATVNPGDLIGYRLAVTNTGPSMLTGAVVTDDLGDVIDDATLGDLPAGAAIAGSILTWHVPPVAAGGTVTLHYPAQVNAGAFGATLRNTATPTSVGGACDVCTTVAHTPAWTLAKDSDLADGAVVEPGDVITYTLTATNTSEAEVTGAEASDDLSGVLDDATVGFTSAELSLAGDRLTWAIPTLAAHQTRTVSYTATVTATGAIITNTVTPIGVGASCTGCSTTAYSQEWTLAKTSDPSSGAQLLPGQVASYTLAVTNTGPVPLGGAKVTDDVSGLAAATLGDLPAGLVRVGDTLTWDVPEVAVGATVTITYTATVNPDAFGATLTNTASPASAGGSCAGCSTTAYTPKWTLAKTSDPASGAVVQPGDVLSYTLTVTNEAGAALTGAVVTDDLADVLDDAALVGLPAGATLDGTVLTWQVPAVAVAGKATLNYQVGLADGATGATLRNVAAPDSPGGACTVCETLTHTAAWTLTKTSDPGSGATVEPGDQVGYTLTVANTGPAMLAGAVVVDDMSGLLDDADLSSLPAGTSLSGGVLTWAVPDVPVGRAVSVQYTVTVKPGAYGITLDNVATGDGADSCTRGKGVLEPFAAQPEADCSTRHFSPAWTLTKTSDPASGSVVEPGSAITFTLKVRNTSQAVVAHAVVTDDLSALLEYSVLAGLPAGSSLAGGTLTWTVPTLLPGEEVELTYSVIVGEDAYNAAFSSPATPSGGGTCPVVCSTEHTTTPAVVDPTHDDGHDGDRAESDSSLAHTGGGLGALGLGLVLLAGGVGMLAVSRRRPDGRE